ncbi:MAG TPA: DUF3168 domain-containing protein [Methylophilaceae bacterium]
MFPPIFQAVNVPAVHALLKSGSGPLRFFLFGQAPQGVQYPYAVWRQSGGSPENYLAGRPDADSFTTQIDVYASQEQGAATARAVAIALRDAIEGHAHITSWIGDGQDPETKSYSFTFIADWLTSR